MGDRRTSRVSRILWALCVVLGLLLVVDQVLQFVDANNSQNPFDKAIRQAIKRRKQKADTAPMKLGNLVQEITATGRQAQDDMDGSGADYADENELDVDPIMNQRASVICAFGIIFSIYTLVMEQLKWDMKSFQRFSVATKIPVEVFCISGPLVLVSAIIYSILAGLLLTGSSSSSAFFIASSWSAIMIDMSFVCYNNALYEILTNKVDFILHVVNLATVYHTFIDLRFFPYIFVVCGLSFWAVVIGIRLVRRFRGGAPPQVVSQPGFRPGSP